MQVRAFERYIPLICLAQGHNTVMPVRLQPAIPLPCV